ncbi:hypothetical protein BGZ94_008963 [Podila epigama]|nr:hypothetical protein BGZ94_008963 [Podila epigama]
MTEKSLHVLIVGGGVSGLLLALLMERAQVSYMVIERQAEADYNLKGILQLTATSLGVLDQLGILPEYMALAKVSRGVSLFKSDLEFVGHYPTQHHESHFGYPTTVITRMAFCRLLLSKIPRENIRWKQHITEIIHGDSGVSVHCTDGSTTSSSTTPVSATTPVRAPAASASCSVPASVSMPTSTSASTSASPSASPSASMSASTPGAGTKQQHHASCSSMEEYLNDLREFALHPGSLSSQARCGLSGAAAASIRYYGQSYNTSSRSRGVTRIKPWSLLRRVRYDGDILVGADGAYSQVRQSLYERMAVIGRRVELAKAQQKTAHKVHSSPIPPLQSNRSNDSISNSFCSSLHNRQSLRRVDAERHFTSTKSTSSSQVAVSAPTTPPSSGSITLTSDSFSAPSVATTTSLPIHSDPKSKNVASSSSGSLVEGDNRPNNQEEKLRRSQSLGDFCRRLAPSHSLPLQQEPTIPVRSISLKPEISKADKLPLRVTEVAIFGITDRLSHDDFPEAAGRFANIKLVGDKDSNYSIFTSSLGNNSIAWSVVGPVNHCDNVQDGNFGQSEWGVELVEALMNRCRHIKSPWGGVLGDLFNQTPKSTICKHLIEEKLFSTWFYGRTCLMGDACHKLTTYAGLAGESSIADAVCLASMIKHLPGNPTSDMITNAFDFYREKRYHHVKVAMYWSREFGRAVLRKGRVSNVVRKAWYKMPSWVHRSLIDRIYYPKIQNVQFLPSVRLTTDHHHKLRTRIECWDSEQIVQRIRGCALDDLATVTLSSPVSC